METGNTEMAYSLLRSAPTELFSAGREAGQKYDCEAVCCEFASDHESVAHGPSLHSQFVFDGILPAVWPQAATAEAYW